MNTLLLYTAAAEAIIILIFFPLFLFLRNIDKDHIQKLREENKKQRANNLKQEVARMSLLRQIDENKEIMKRKDEKIAKIKNQSFGETLNDL